VTVIAWAVAMIVTVSRSAIVLVTVPWFSVVIYVKISIVVVIEISPIRIPVVISSGITNNDNNWSPCVGVVVIVVLQQFHVVNNVVKKISIQRISAQKSK